MKLLSLLTVFTISLAHAQAVPGDIDGDGIRDRDEDANGNGIVDQRETDPMNADTDGGGEADGSEVRRESNPLDRQDDLTYDRDGDGLTNGEEALLGTDSRKRDTDGDGLNDKEDPFPLDARYSSDNDNDGIPDEYEREHGLDSTLRSDADDDKDNDGLSNVDEFVQETDIDNPDTDADGVEDGEEIELGTSPVENPCLMFVGPGEKLHDIQGHWAEKFILSLQQTKILPEHRRIIEGYDDIEGRVFLPDREITRFELLKLALMSNCIADDRGGADPTFEFSDVRRAKRPHESDSEALLRTVVYQAQSLGIVHGYPDGTFRPHTPVNRVEAMKILFETTGLEPFDDGDYSGRFSDTNDHTWYTPYLENALSYDFVEGYPDGTFRPENFITRSEAAKLVLFMMISNPKVNGYVVPVEDLGL